MHALLTSDLQERRDNEDVYMPANVPRSTSCPHSNALTKDANDLKGQYLLVPGIVLGQMLVSFCGSLKNNNKPVNNNNAMMKYSNSKIKTFIIQTFVIYIHFSVPGDDQKYFKLQSRSS